MCGQLEAVAFFNNETHCILFKVVSERTTSTLGVRWPYWTPSGTMEYSSRVRHCWANADSYQSDTELSRRIRTFSSANLTKYLPDDFTNFRDDEAEVKSDDEQNWIFVYTFKDSSRYFLGIFSSREGTDSLRVEVCKTNSEYLIEGADLTAVHEVENIRPGWNFLVCEITKREDDIRLTGRLTDKTLQRSGSEQLDFGSLKTMLNLGAETMSPAVIDRIWDGHSYNDGFVYCQSHEDKNPKNEPLVSLKFKSPSKEQSKHLRIDFRLFH